MIPSIRLFPKRVTYDSRSHSRVIVPVCGNARVINMLSVSDSMPRSFSRASHRNLRHVIEVVSRALCVWWNVSVTGPRRAVYTVTATPKKTVNIVHISNPRTLRVASHVFASISDSTGSLSSEGSRALAFKHVRAPGNRAVSRILIDLFGAPRSCANRSDIRVSYRNSSCVLRRIVRLLVRRKYGVTNPNRFARQTFLGKGLSLDRTRTMTSLVSSSSTAARHVTVGRVHNKFDGRLSVLHRGLLRLASLVRLRLSFDSRRRLRFTSHARLRRVTGTVRAIVDHLIRSFDVNGTLGGNVPITVVKRAGTKGSALLGTLLGRRGTVIDSVRNAAHSIVRSAVGLKNVAFHFVSATNVHRARSRVRGVKVSHDFSGLRRTRVIL